MATESPLFQSAIDLLAHSIEHFNSGTEKDRKFVILHLANSVELIFKDLVLDKGKSIYKSPKETISHYAAKKILEEDFSITIPEGNKLELLVDERNALQHRYGSPNDLTATFHMHNVYNFFRDFLKDNYNQSIDEVLKDFLPEKEIDNFLFISSSTKDELKKLSDLAKMHPAGALLASYAFLEKSTLDIIKNVLTLAQSKNFKIPKILPDLNRYLAWVIKEFNIEVEEKLLIDFGELRRNRNQISHGRKENITTKEVLKSISTIRQIIPVIQSTSEKIEKWFQENPVPLNAQVNEKALKFQEKLSSVMKQILEQELNRSLNKKELDDIKNSFLSYTKSLSDEENKRVNSLLLKGL